MRGPREGLRLCPEKRSPPLPSGHYWGTPHAPFALDGPICHDAVFPGAHCVSDGKWVIFYQDGNEVWACNAVYAAAHFDVAPLPSACSSTAD